MISARSGSNVYIIWRKHDGKYTISRVTKSFAKEMLHREAITLLDNGEPIDLQPIAILKTLDIDIEEFKHTLEYGKLAFVKHK